MKSETIPLSPTRNSSPNTLGVVRKYRFGPIPCLLLFIIPRMMTWDLQQFKVVASSRFDATTWTHHGNVVVRKPTHFRFLFGIFSCDNPKERLRRQTHRETYLSYYRLHLGNHSTKDTICSLNQLMENPQFISDRRKCQFVYTFVMGGANSTAPARCFWGDPTCAGTLPSDMVLSDVNDSVFSDIAEYSDYRDITLLNVRENLHDGKSETWFSYASALVTFERPDLGIDYVGRLDSDTVTGVELLLRHYKRDARLFANDTNPYTFGGGDLIDGEWCTMEWKICGLPTFIAPIFFGGGMMIFSTPLVQHAYLHATVEELMKFTNDTGLPEDLLTANFAYRDPNITVRLIPLLPEEHDLIFSHNYKEPKDFVNVYWRNTGFDSAVVSRWNRTTRLFL